MSIYDKSVRLLMKDMVKETNLEKGERISKEQILNWFNDKYPKIKSSTVAAHLIRMSVNARSRHHYHAKPIEDDLFFQIDGSTFRLFDKTSDPSPLYGEQKVDDNIDNEVLDTNEDKSEFAYEKDLQNFLSRNLTVIESGLQLFEDEEITGVECPAGGRFIDILAVDRNNNFVIIELKVSRGYDRVVGQVLRYVNWIKKNLAEPNQRVRGIIIAREISEDLLLACEGLSNIDLFEYQLSIELKKV